MVVSTGLLSRRRLLKNAAQAGAALVAPRIIPGSALGKNRAVPASDRVVLAGIGIGGRGAGVLASFLTEPEVQFVAVCDVKADCAAAAPRARRRRGVRGRPRAELLENWSLAAQHRPLSRISPLE